MNVIVACEFPLFRKGILLALKERFKEATIIESEAAPFIPEKCPDLIINCLNTSNLQKIGGWMDITGQNCKNAKLIVIDLVSNPQNLMFCIKKGVKGYLSQTNSTDDFFMCIERVLKGKKFFNEDLLYDLLLKNSRTSTTLSNEKSFNQLTPNETRIARMLAEGRKISVIARELGKSMSTISTVKSNILRKLNIDNVLHLADILQANKEK
jgi:DNA-binding NarL/FixJ family response regulator